MRDTESKVCGAGFYAFAAMQDARIQNIAHASAYSEAKKVRAECLKQILDLVYSSKEIHINFRKKFIAVKVDQARVRDMAARKNLAVLEKDWEAEGITRLVTAQGITLRIPA